MPLSDSRLAYKDCYAFLDQALEDGKGARVPFSNFASASYFRMRCHQARTINKRENKQIYQKGDPMWGLSEYDQLVVRIKEDTEGEFWVYAEIHSTAALEIELLSGLLP